MPIAFTKLPGLDAERLVAVVEPVLRAHRVDGVELVWKTDQSGMVLELTVERPGTRIPGQGITVDLCADISRDLSAALDVADVITPRYRLDVGSPGVERALHSLDDYRRFSGQLAKLKLNGPLDVEGPLKKERTLRGALFGVTDEGLIELETEHGHVLIEFSRITTARLVFEMPKAERPGHSSKAGKSKTALKKQAAKKPAADAKDSTTENIRPSTGARDQDDEAEPRIKKAEQ